ncbi:hypothetical protein Nepgr_030740 [Nepenthes gracilis]|uniref:B box-type domain-containing protein n=1 Tax=Nepenthes gracilis TaxID=150966 RepID=A0AAD3TGB0_NEPGR|nr:hypothetical protein Nepgr_030740 [Nepenthes gracilis]
MVTAIVLPLQYELPPSINVAQSPSFLPSVPPLLPRSCSLQLSQHRCCQAPFTLSSSCQNIDYGYPSLANTVGLGSIPEWLDTLLGESFFGPCLRHESSKVGLGSIPEWLDTLLGESFFGPCLRHESSKKNEKNIFCLDCCASVCPQCLPSHRKHRLLQVQHVVSTQGGLETYLSQHQTETFSDLDDSPDSVLFRHASQPTSSGSSASSSGKNAIPPTTSTATATATLLCTATTEFVKKKRSSISASRLQHRPKCPPATDDAGLNRRKSVPNRSPFY